MKTLQELLASRSTDSRARILKIAVDMMQDEELLKLAKKAKTEEIIKQKKP